MTELTDVAARFWRKVDKSGTCWGWTAGKTAEGYGSFSINRRSVMAHRVAYELTVGPIPDGLHVDHLCRNRACVNPAHMEPVPCRINLLRGIGPSAANARKTHCRHGHEFTPENTRIGGSGGRICATCRPLRPWSSRTHCARGHAFDEANTRVTKEGRRYCRACQTLTQRARRAAA